MDKLTKQVDSSVLSIVGKCVAGALAVAGISVAANANASVPDTTVLRPTTVNASDAVAPQAKEETRGAVLLDILQHDPNTGEMVAMHYSHASHSSHESHASHYSSHY